MKATTMSPDDPRHGKNAGYAQGCKCDACSLAHFRANKERNLYRSRHGSCIIPHAEVAKIVEPWLAMGFTMNAIAAAGNVATSGDFRRTYQAGSPVYRDTYKRLKAIREDMFPSTALVFADLTRTRIFSLIAAGHALKDMPILSTGSWRIRERINVKQARDIRDHFRALEATMGPNRQKAAQARNAGHLPPFGWDDPGTLAWPKQPPKDGCGTRRGYEAHLRAGEPTCDECRKDNAARLIAERRAA